MPETGIAIGTTTHIQTTGRESSRERSSLKKVVERQSKLRRWRSTRKRRSVKRILIPPGLGLILETALKLVEIRLEAKTLDSTLGDEDSTRTNGASLYQLDANLIHRLKYESSLQILQVSYETQQRDFS